MANVIFCGFGDGMDKRVQARTGDVLLRVAESNGVKIPTECKDGTCGSCAVKIEDLSVEETMNPTTEDYDAHAQSYYMEDKELETLVEMAAITKKEAEVAQQFNRQTPVRLACQCIVRSDIIVKPFE
ncbi:2Fe-2S iron-sulfur cluster binding domain-containing protein [Sulfurimonas sp. HSL-3221]|uniref:2Fe-2S iron-sulfur cluster binding domain-containing protein n=1 Tax=Sulfurimonas diazotrophicus TaxID=3131939 RepID=A0ABZ3H8V1_9BACT|nr:2Fe-2S iron-sulfur cluster binding domain-containing protein [Sulfurimonas sp. HSL-3221]UFS61525.1 2Fe-2S iron-sulfur cluster binding domain-containing protein [Sulfurimonas sp. HSL-3221]